MLILVLYVSDLHLQGKTTLLNAIAWEVDPKFASVAHSEPDRDYAV